MTQRIVPTIILCMALVTSALAFVPSANLATVTISAASPLKASPLPVEVFATADASFLSSPAVESSSSLLSLATLDPTTILSDVLGGLLGSSAILAVPIIAALGIAGLIAFLIVSYANPADEDD
eukprot:CAMPEP_0181084522 /NCGR_PEP_ID=MMETSP1071-20121207/4740_1 /TAXON_ID=35127 /ORGANISM="Thalassiosira sp., Strain NH16" /LENGTH=123 /DNA_ID=CAMNT_0023166261 /DNA_START=142 /DNA_END=513 /DNA_ORIENTATION=-